MDTVEFPFQGAWREQPGGVVLLGSRCGGCGKRAFPAPAVCDSCGATGGFREEPLGPTGLLYAFTEVHAAPVRFHPPYVLGFVDLPGDVRVLARIGEPVARLRPGDELAARVGTIGTDEQGREIVSYTFQKREQ